MTIRLPTLIATSVVRGSRQGESHGGVFKVDFEKRDVVQLIDWDTGKIDFEGRGGDRGLRGIAFGGDDILIAASDELFRFDRSFKLKTSNKLHYLKHCHEICVFEQMVFLTSTGFDSLLAFDLGKKKFVWGFHLQWQYDHWAGHTFNPRSNMGPRPVNNFHINMVHVDSTGIYLSGLRTNALLHINGKMEVSKVCSLPSGAHNARPYREGILFNDTENDCIRYTSRDGEDIAFKIATYDDSDIEFAGFDETNIARQGFGRGLCPAGNRLVAGGSSPSTISLYDFEGKQKVESVNLTMDIRNAIHGLETWPYND
ncbi:MAG: hypothetical protein ACC641_09285 [Acidiferrobacterales bacterium]